MKKKIILIIAIVLIVIVGAGTGVVTYAVWDSKKEDLSIEFGTGSDYRITLNMHSLDQPKNFRPDGELANQESSSEVIIRKFDLTLKEYNAVTFTVVNIEMKETNKSEPINANAFMAVTIYEGEVIDANKIVTTDQYLIPGTTYIVTFKFTVDSSSDLLTTDMQNAKISAIINFVGYTIPDQGGNA